MKPLILLPMLLLAGCASAPAYLVDAKRSVDSRMEYVSYETKGTSIKSINGVVLNHTYKKPTHLADNQGNCLDIAFEYQKEVGGGFVIRERRIGVDHAYLWVDGYVLDNQYSYVFKSNK